MTGSPAPRGIPESALRGFLADLGDGYAVAKAPHIWENLRRGGDWDLVVSDLPRALRMLEARVGRPDAVLRRSYVWCTYFPWGEVDLLPGLSWRGLQLVTADDVLSGAVDSSGAPRVARPAHEAMAACVYPLLAHGSYKAAYRPVLERARLEDGAEFNGRLSEVFGPSTARWIADSCELAPRDRPVLVRAAWRRALLRPRWRDAAGLAAFMAGEGAYRAAGLRHRPDQ